MTTQKKKSLIGLKKASTLLLRVVKMIENDEYCVDIMQQNLAVMGLLKSAHQTLMENHLNTCFKDAVISKNEKLRIEMTKEILRVTKLCNK